MGCGRLGQRGGQRNRVRAVRRLQAAALAVGVGACAPGGTANDCSEVPPIHAGDLSIGPDSDAAYIECLEGVEGAIFISGSQKWPDLAPLLGIRTANALSVNGAEGLISLEGLANLASLDEDLSIADNPTLVSIRGLRGLRRMSGMRISSNPVLESIEGPTGDIEVIVGEYPIGYGAMGVIYIQDNPALVDLDGFLTLDSWVLPGPPSFSADVIVRGNENLADVSGMSHLFSGDLPGSNFWFIDNPQQKDLLALENVTLAGDISATGLGGLESLRGLDSLRTVEGSLLIAGSPGLEDLAELAGLRQVNELTVGSCLLGYGGNENLRTLNGLGSLEEVGYGLAVEGNKNLVDIVALETLAASDESFGVSFKGNDRLEVSDIVDFLVEAGKPVDPDAPVEDLPPEICGNAGQEERSCSC